MSLFNPEGRPVALVTGSSSGFGLLCTVELAKAGFYVVASMRNLEKKGHVLQAAKESGVEERIYLYRLDVASVESVANLRASVERWGRIDVLVNNAGFALGGFAEEVTLEEWRAQFETNFFGLVHVTQTILPVMRERRQGRIINMSSISGQMGFPGLSPYVSSKFAVEGFSESLRLEVAPFGIDVVLIEPGSYATGIWSTGKRIAHKSTLCTSPYASMMSALDSYLTAGEMRLGNPWEVAECVAQIAVIKRAALRYPLGRGVQIIMKIKQWLPWRIWEKLMERTLKS